MMIIIKFLLSQGDNLSSGKQNIPRNRLFVRRRPISVRWSVFAATEACGKTEKKVYKLLTQNSGFQML